MVDLGGVFDPNTVEPQKPMEPLPTGWYAMKVIESQIKEVASGNGNRYLQLDLEIDEAMHPEYKGRMAWARLNLWNANQTAADIAQRELSAICRSIGCGPTRDTSDLHFKPLAVRLAYRPAKGDFGEGNDVKGFDSVASRFQKPPTATPQAGTTTAGEPAAPTGDKPPWAN